MHWLISNKIRSIYLFKDSMPHANDLLRQHWLSLIKRSTWWKLLHRIKFIPTIEHWHVQKMMESYKLVHLSYGHFSQEHWLPWKQPIIVILAYRIVGTMWLLVILTERRDSRWCVTSWFTILIISLYHQVRLHKTATYLKIQMTSEIKNHRRCTIHSVYIFLLK